MAVLILLCCFFASLHQISAQQQLTDPAEVAALSKLAEYWNLKDRWNFNVDPCAPNASWAASDANPRIGCDCVGSTCHVTHMKVYALDIMGEIPKELFVLKELMDLNLGQNVLSGPIPAEIGQLSKMQYLSLGINNLSSFVPPELGNLTNLISLSFSSNKFIGGLPKELGNLASLEQLYIDSAGVTGEFPQEMAKMKSLKIIWASDNHFTGKIPEFLGSFTNLTDLRLQGTSLEGPIPNTFAALTKLENLRLGDLSKEDSSLSFLEKLTSLSILSLRNSRLTGQIPGKLVEFPNLKYLDLSFNKLTGQIPISFQDFKSLEMLYLGNNNLNGELPPNIITPNLVALDVSFNSIYGSFPLNHEKLGSSMNFAGTSIDANSLYDKNVVGVLHCLQNGSTCNANAPTYSSFSINCGGENQISATGIHYYNDCQKLGSASLYVSPEGHFAVSNTGVFISNPNGPQYIASTDSQITRTLESELYKTARISPSSLRYYGFGLENGKYNVELHFAEIAMEDSISWKGLGRRLFDAYIQGERVLQDFNIQDEAGGSKRALVKKFEANVSNSIMEVHFFWAGKGTCCIPYQGTYGPLVSAIHAYRVSGSDDVGSPSKSDKKRVGRFVGVVIGCIGAVFIVSSIVYLWRTKEKTGNIRVYTESQRRKRDRLL
ncbi:hypothetical protein Sjap_019285 [Stephania japonica]|uniref:non-specific serine/threonine protein kinase n=1 Tax=Stephania japonica TaxID=461633 RepID=A0AAP0HZ73_9MAGN